MSTSCKGLREEILECLKQSECFQSGKSIKECMKADQEGVSAECRALQASYFECRRGLLDMRNRFRGNQGS